MVVECVNTLRWKYYWIVYDIHGVRGITAIKSIQRDAYTVFFENIIQANNILKIVYISHTLSIDFIIGVTCDKPTSCHPTNEMYKNWCSHNQLYSNWNNLIFDILLKILSTTFLCIFLNGSIDFIKIEMLFFMKLTQKIFRICSETYN